MKDRSFLLPVTGEVSETFWKLIRRIINSLVGVQKMENAIKWIILIIGALFGAVAWNSKEKNNKE